MDDAPDTTITDRLYLERATLIGLLSEADALLAKAQPPPGNSERQIEWMERRDALRRHVASFTMPAEPQPGWFARQLRRTRASGE